MEAKVSTEGVSMLAHCFFFINQSTNFYLVSTTQIPGTQTKNPDKEVLTGPVLLIQQGTEKHTYL